MKFSLVFDTYLHVKMLYVPEIIFIGRGDDSEMKVCEIYKHEQNRIFCIKYCWFAYVCTFNMLKVRRFMFWPDCMYDSFKAIVCLCLPVERGGKTRKCFKNTNSMMFCKTK